MVKNFGLHFRYYSKVTLRWAKDNKLIIFLGTLSFCLFVSTLVLSSQRNSVRQEIVSLRASLAQTTTPASETSTDNEGSNSTENDVTTEPGIITTEPESNGTDATTEVEYPTETPDPNDTTVCRLSLKTDFGRPSPVFLRKGEFLGPDASSGVVAVRASESVVVACPGDKRVVLGNDTSDFDVLEAHCVTDNKFRVGEWVGEFSDITCSAQVWVSSEEVNGGCVDGHELHRIGYKIKNEFYEVYQACFNPDVLHTVYVKREITPANLFFEPDSKRRPPFFEGTLFRSVSMAKAYNLNNQKNRLETIHGVDPSNYISTKEQLTRGHLAARGDFSLGAEQRASFHYVNSAPQWFGVNAGPWAAVEADVRRRVNMLGRSVTVYTGSLGDSIIEGKPFYLSADKNNNDVVPVPLYFFKLVYDEFTQSAVAFISINQSSLKATVATPQDICASVCDEYPWLTWNGKGNTCCTYEALSKVARLPALEVKSLLQF